MKQVDALTVLRAYVKREGSQAKAAHSLGMSRQLLNIVLRGNVGVSDKLLDKLGLRRLVVSK